MKYYYIFFLIVFSALTTGCSSTKTLVSQSQEADLLYYQKDYLTAFDVYSKVIEGYVSKSLPVPGEVYASAGKCLYYSGTPSSAMEYFRKAEEAGVDDEQILVIRMKYYAEVDNMSKEIDCLEKYSALYSTGSEIGYVNLRLFLRYVEMKEYRKAYLRFKAMTSETQDQIQYIEKFYNVCEKLGKQEEANEVARELYNRNPNNLIGLNYMAYSTYTSTENEYVAAVKAYEAKKTNANYKIMVNKTKPLVERYRKAKKYFVQLYNLYKRPADAAVLARICSRLNEKQNAAYYEKLSKKK